MINIRDLRIDPNCLGKEMRLVSIAPAFKYADGVRTNEVQGHRYSVILPAVRYERLGVKILGPQLMDAADITETGVPVTFEGLEIRPFEKNGQILISATATGISVVDGAKRG